MGPSEYIARLVLPAFVAEIIAVPVAVACNHNTTHSGGWQDLAVGLGDVFILGGAILCSFLWVIAAFTQLKRYKKLPAPDDGAANHCAVGLLLHCSAIFALSIAGCCLLY